MNSRIAYLQSADYLHVPVDIRDSINEMYAVSTKHYGPYWFTLFTMILGTYPVKVDFSNEEHKNLVHHFVTLLSGLRYTLPCKFCRESFANFYKELPIEQFTSSRIRLALWLYLIKDKVNTKLLGQEREYLLKVEQDYIEGNISKKDLLEHKKKCFKTVPSPPFREVLEYYAQFSAKCSKKIQKCVSKDTLVF